MSTTRHQWTRRRFLQTTAATAGGILLPGVIGIGAETKDFPSTNHFWYRPQPEGLFVDSQRENKAFAWSGGKVLLSEDNGRTWPFTAEFTDAHRILFSCILKNGNVLFSTLAKLYLATDNLKDIRQITVKDIDGSDYIPHTPKDPARPGWYFHSLSGESTWDVNGREMVVWGNYCNVLDGATPVNIYYSTDGGETVKIAYSFGQNPYYQDQDKDGSPGTLIGNPDHKVICRHVHCVAYNLAEDAFYACTGDSDRPDCFECHWLRGTYDAANDKWDWKVIISDHLNSRYKAGGISFVDGRLYWISDSNGPEPYDRGIFSCDPADVANKDKHTRHFNPGVESGCMIVQDGVFLASHCAPASTMDTGFIISTDAGKTWAQYDLKEFGKRSPCRFHRMNSDGWFRVDLRQYWVTPAEMMFIKPKVG